MDGVKGKRVKRKDFVVRSGVVEGRDGNTNRQGEGEGEEGMNHTNLHYFLE